MAKTLVPVASTGLRPSGAQPLAGSDRVWFNSLRDKAGAQVSLEDAPSLVDALSAPRPDLLGLDLSQPRVMGIINATPDSFSDGGNRLAVADAVRAAQEMVAAGAEILDIGGESTRPGAETVPEAEEIRRVAPVIEAIRDAGIVTIVSIDTRKSSVAEVALQKGANLVNDVSAMTYDSAMMGLVAERGCPVVLMHSKGTPKTMQDAPRYDDVVAEVSDFLAERLDAARGAGIAQDALIADPGIGFGKTLEHNLTLLRSLSALHNLGVPILLGASRKRFIGTLGNAADAQSRMPGSLAVALHGAGQGAHILRVHDAAETRQAIALWRAVI